MLGKKFNSNSKFKFLALHLQSFTDFSIFLQKAIQLTKKNCISEFCDIRRPQGKNQTFQHST